MTLESTGTPWGGGLWLLPERRAMLFVGSGSASTSHRHHAVQLVVALGGELRLSMDGESHRLRSTLIPRDARHAVDVVGPMLSLWVEPHSAEGHLLDAWADDLRGQEIGIGPEVLPPRSGREVVVLVDALLRELGIEDARARVVTPHVRRALEYVDAALTLGPTLAGAAELARISPSRLTHLFTAEVGIPFRRYVLWQRLQRAVEAVGDGHDLTHAAAEAGFSDSAHLSRTFRSTVGLSPSALKVLQIAKV